MARYFETASLVSIAASPLSLFGAAFVAYNFSEIHPEIVVDDVIDYAIEHADFSENILSWGHEEWIVALGVGFPGFLILAGILQSLSVFDKPKHV